MKILLDTNFLINCAKFHLDYSLGLRGHSLYVLDQTIRELENLINQKKAPYAKLALGILKKKTVRILKTSKKGGIRTFSSDVDSLLAEKKGYAIATADKELKNNIKNKRIFVIRQKKYIKEI